jgi:hypothetical protein
MEISQIWKSLFERWPQDLPRRGVVTTTLDEQIPFKGFMLTRETVLLERTNPDPLGTRFIVLPYPNMAAVKLVDVIKEKIFTSMGFEGKLSGK